MTSAAPWRLCSWLSEGGHASARKLRLLACAWARRVLPLANKKRARLALEAAGLHADGLLTEEELRQAHKQARAVLVGHYGGDAVGACASAADPDCVLTLVLV
jgi:hypothetical protein